MRRLTAYLVRLIAVDALLLFGIMIVLLWLVQALRSFDVVSVQGQGVFTLAAQALLAMPPLAVVFLYVCVGIGLARALRALQASHELHIIHSAVGFGAEVRATLAVAMGGALAVLVLANFVDPLSVKRLNLWSATIAADLVSSTLTPQVFMEVVPDVVVLIGGRQGNGEITEFFADDRRDADTRRTYVANRATVAATSDGYVLQLRDGSLQQLTIDGRFSEVRFDRYDVAIDQLTTEVDDIDRLAETDSFTLVREALEQGAMSNRAQRRLAERLSEGVRVLGISVLVLSLAGFPSGKRRVGGFPIEVVVLLIAFLERAISAYLPGPPLLMPFTGALGMLISGLAILAWRTRRRIPASLRGRPA